MPWTWPETARDRRFSPQILCLTKPPDSLCELRVFAKSLDPNLNGLRVYDVQAEDMRSTSGACQFTLEVAHPSLRSFTPSEFSNISPASGISRCIDLLLQTSYPCRLSKD